MMNNELEAKLIECRISVAQPLDYTMMGLLNKITGEIYTIHTEKHSKVVEKNLKSIVKICNYQSDTKCYINEEEEFILYCSAWLHDLGNIISRENHAKYSSKIIMENPDMIHGIDEYRQFIADVSGVHSYDEKIEKDPIIHLSKTIRTKKSNIVKLQYISAVFRLADACDMDNRKAPKLVYNLLSKHMGETSLNFWKGHNTIYSCNILENEIEITFTEKSKSSEFVFDWFTKQFENVRPWLKQYNFPITKVKENYFEDQEDWKKYLSST